MSNGRKSGGADFYDQFIGRIRVIILRASNPSGSTGYCDQRRRAAELGASGRTCGFINDTRCRPQSGGSANSAVWTINKRTA